MKTIILVALVAIFASMEANAQAERVYQTDSMKSGRTSASFFINSRHNYNTVMFKNLVNTDSVRVYNVNEFGDTTAVALRNLNDYSDLRDNLIAGYSTGNYEFLVLNPNVYRLVIKWVRTASLSKTITVRRRGNNLK